MYTQRAALTGVLVLIALSCTPRPEPRQPPPGSTPVEELLQLRAEVPRLAAPAAPAPAFGRAHPRASGVPQATPEGENQAPMALAFYQAADGGVPQGVEGGVAGGVPGGVPGDLEGADEVLAIALPGLTLSPSDVPRGSGEQGRIALRAVSPDGEEIGEFPLRHTSVQVDIAGPMARTDVRQEFANPFAEPIEAVYVFPLGAAAAVSDFVMEVGGRRIVGVVRPRQEAEQIYQQARARGQTASLLTQERPNIFTQHVANIAPGRSVTVTTTTFDRLRYIRGTYEYVFPMVVGPRYIPGSAVPEPARAVGGGGWSPRTSVVPDADRITPQVLKPGERSGHDIELAVRLDAGVPIREVSCPTHEVEVTEHGGSSRTVRLVEADRIADRDFVLRWTVGGRGVQTAVLTHRGDHGGFFSLLVQPPLQPADRLVTPREMTFILDVSGSMSGIPLETSKALVTRVLDRLRAHDLFNIVLFSGANAMLWETPRQGTADNVEEARRFLLQLRGSGGTEMLAGLRRALAAPHDPQLVQMFVFCTDGFVGDEERILATVSQERGEARFYAFGIGSSVNRYLIDGIGRVGGGRSLVVLPRESGGAEQAAERFFDFIEAPVLFDAAIDWNGLPVADVYPRRLGDLFAATTLDVVGRYTRPAEGTAFLTGRVGSRHVRIPVQVALPASAPSHRALAPVWARWRIADLSDDLLRVDDSHREGIVKAITDLAVEFRLASQYTSFVAVDESEVVGAGQPMRVDQPVSMPQDVSYEGVFGSPPPSPTPAESLRLP